MVLSQFHSPLIVTSRLMLSSHMLSFQSVQFQTAFMTNFYVYSLSHMRHLPCCIVIAASIGVYRILGTIPVAGVT